MKLARFCWLLLATISSSAYGEQLFVEDKLVLSVYAESDQSGGRIATIETGDAVEALERVDKFVRVRLSDGREGWVGANYLSAEPPAVLKLKELERASKEAEGAGPNPLAADVARLKKQNASLQIEISALQKRLAAIPAVTPESTAPDVGETPPPAATAPMQAASDASPKLLEENRNYAWAWAIALVLTGGGGFAAGYQTLGRRVRQRFGGVKVY